jgi:DNA modification methylase
MKKKTEHTVTMGFHDEGEPEKTSLENVPHHKRANDLDGRDWVKNSISIWSDIAWTKEERLLKHPAKFPVNLAERLIRSFTKSSEKRILDPFLGSGSTLVAAKNLGRQGIGFDVYETYVKLSKERLRQEGLFTSNEAQPLIYLRDAREMDHVLEPESVDICITSPPYWDILTQKRTADGKDIRNYGDSKVDLGMISDYNEFLDELMNVFRGVKRVLKDGKYFIINVMDLRKKENFYPYHMDLSKRVIESGFVLDDIIIWDRRKDYNNLRALGYPYKFRVNKVHEFLMIFQKPKATS